MNKRTLVRLAGSSLIVACSMVGCSGAQLENRPAIASSHADDIARSIEQALAKRDFARALIDAERLVEAQPRLAENRSLLGRAYLANGRFHSARTAFEDAMVLGAEDSRTIVSLSLARTALGDADSARNLLRLHIGNIPAADYGLAMAMAGDPAAAVEALTFAVREPDATAQTRQNLAYALALGGQWGQARLVAGHDLTGSALQARLTEWASVAEQNSAPQRVAALIGVAPRADDTGMPTRLALSASEPVVLATAPATPDDLAMEAASALTEDAQASAAESAMLADAATEPATMAFAGSADGNVPLIKAPASPARQMVMNSLASGVSRIPAGDAAAVPVERMSDWVVQIGAYGRSAALDQGWQRMVSRKMGVETFRKQTGTIALKGRTYHRLALSGFSDRAHADGYCGKLRASGITCFVRRDDAVATMIRMARTGKATRIAAR